MNHQESKLDDSNSTINEEVAFYKMEANQIRVFKIEKGKGRSHLHILHTSEDNDVKERAFMKELSCGTLNDLCLEKLIDIIDFYTLEIVDDKHYVRTITSFEKDTLVQFYIGSKETKKP
jgi:hypothetical protein